MTENESAGLISRASSAWIYETVQSGPCCWDERGNCPLLTSAGSYLQYHLNWFKTPQNIPSPGCTFLPLHFCLHYAHTKASVPQGWPMLILLRTPREQRNGCLFVCFFFCRSFSWLSYCPSAGTAQAVTQGSWSGRQRAAATRACLAACGAREIRT